VPLDWVFRCDGGLSKSLDESQFLHQEPSNMRNLFGRTIANRLQINKATEDIDRYKLDLR
jgi:hypothetical protein